MNKVFDPTDWMQWEDYLALKTGVTPGGVVEPGMVDAGMIDLVVKCLESPIFTMRNFFKTVDKDTGSLVGYEPWTGQTMFEYVRLYQQQCGYPQRIVEIKARQVGFTQHNINLAIHNCLFPNRKSVIMMPDQDVLDENAPRIGAIINNLPPWLTLMRRIENKNQWEFDNPDSRERLLDPGQSSTLTLCIPSSYRGAPGINFVCFSEFAQYDDAHKVMEGVMNGIGKTASTCVTIDTTPFHHDPVYEPMVRRAIKRNPIWAEQWERKGGFTRQDIIDGKLGVPDNPKGWVPVFIAWWQHEQYTTKDESPHGQLPKMTKKEIDEMMFGEVGSQRIGTVEQYGGDEELWLMKEIGVSLYRLAWRRFAIDDVEASDWRYKLLSFHQEYATRWHDCFIDYGLTPFDPIGLEVIRNQIRRPYVRGRLREGYDEGGRLKIGVDPTYISEFDEVRVWTTPIPGEAYIIAVDPAYAWESDDSDWTFAQVIRRRDRKQVAVYDARKPVHEICEQLKLLYRWYNNALTIVETADGGGYAFVRMLYDTGVRNQYYWKRTDQDVPDSTKYLGWQSDHHTKPTMYSTMVKAVSDLAKWSRLETAEREDIVPPIVIRDEKTYYELASCKRRADGDIKAAGRNHDDSTTAMMIAYCVNEDPEYGMPMNQLKKEKLAINALFEQYGVPEQHGRFMEKPLHV